jgi:hypothetical protein
MMAITGIDAAFFIPQLLEDQVVIGQLEAVLNRRAISKRQPPSF